MTDFPRKKVKILCIAAAVITLAALGAAVFSGVELWLLHQPKFQDVTIELGTDSIGIDRFLARGARADRASFTAGAAQVDLNAAGDHEMILRYGDRLESVTLHIEDTTAPEVEFIPHRVVFADRVPEAREFVKRVEDHSETTVAFAREPELPPDHGDLTVTVVVTDASGNKTSGECTLEQQWLRDSFTLELGDLLTKEDLLARPELDGDRISQGQLDRINVAGVGSYTVTAEGETAVCEVRVQDTRGPELVLQPVRRKSGSNINVDHFVRSVADYSGSTQVRLLTELDPWTEGFQPVTVEAVDSYGNVTRGETTLQITEDLNAPMISRLPDMKVAVYSTPDYLAGVTAWDHHDGYVEMTVDDSQVRLSTLGSYTAIYRATDAAGNTATSQRTVEVVGNDQDPTELVKKTAAGLSDDPEEIRDFVRQEIAYSHEWGEGDPVVYGLTRMRGNCYVHALCLEALFNEKGIENQLIWTTNKSHYWLLVKVGDVWRHIDPTPSNVHNRYSLMTDAQRLSTLDGRAWDQNAWPACK